MKSTFLLGALAAILFLGISLSLPARAATSVATGYQIASSDDGDNDDNDSAENKESANDAGDKDDGNDDDDRASHPHHAAAPIATGNWWHPRPGTSWQIQYADEKTKNKDKDSKQSAVIDTSYKVAMYDLDLFDVDQKMIDDLHNRGIKVVCYFSAGSYEDWRPDIKRFPPSVLGKNMEGWKGERWLDIRKLNVLRPIMEDRIKLASKKKCDGVDPDNVEGFENATGFHLSYQDQIAFNTMIAELAHKYGMAVGLKNDTSQVEDLVGIFDFQVNEQCFEYHSCNDLIPFIQANKPVFNIEYNVDPSRFCAQANEMNFDSLKKRLELDAWTKACR